MPRLTDTEARQWRNRAIDAERELAAIKRRFARLTKTSFVAILADGVRPQTGTIRIETVFVDSSACSVRVRNYLHRIEAQIHANIREAGGETEEASPCASPAINENCTGMEEGGAE